ncbi:hypothetical protein [Alteromonas sp. M12]|uniref:hypothetical protein n=1 Tax=Alteromonas sp. M12 TaxID=3135644 RepID=UPI00319E0664
MLQPRYWQPHGLKTMLPPVVGGFSPEMNRLNPKLDWENPVINPWPKGHATPVVGGFSPEMDRFNTEIGERKSHGLKAMLHL